VEVIAADDLNNAADLAFALRAAVSGRLVLGELESDSARETLAIVLRLSEPARSKRDGLKLIINQRLGALSRPAKGRHLRQAIGVFTLLSPGAQREKIEDYRCHSRL